MDFSFGEVGFGDIYTPWWALVVTLLVVMLIVAAIIFAVSYVGKDGEPFRFETRDITYAAVCVSIAFALSFFCFTLPFGGSITPFSTLPIMIYCYYFGFRKGAIICTVFMMLQFLQNPYVISPWSALFDYIIPYMSLIFLGVFCFRSGEQGSGKQTSLLKRHTRFFIGAAIYVAVRYLSHVLSGVLFFGEYAWEGWDVLPYSLVYNSFIFIDFAIAMIAGVCLLMSRSFNAFMAKSIDAKRTHHA